MARGAAALSSALHPDLGLLAHLVERFFAEITDKCIRRGAFNSIAKLETAIMDYLEKHNANPKPFVWTASAGSILEKVARAKQASESVQ